VVISTLWISIIPEEKAPMLNPGTTSTITSLLCEGPFQLYIPMFMNEKLICWWLILASVKTNTKKQIYHLEIYLNTILEGDRNGLPDYI